MSNREIVGYIPTWVPGIMDKVDTKLCTIFVIAFGTIDSAGNVKLPDNFSQFKKLKTPTSKLMLALGGADDKAKKAFGQIAALPGTRAKFAQNCFNIVNEIENRLDGIDIDWEFPEFSDRANFVALHKDLKDK